ncbi:hypothetical protein [Microbacterium sp. cf046]|uniref:hypothetical protein n=1 Tax=Microbacterium sp. cf046 TaxID=1761803 RepID=UPI0020C893E8|nr:hypothetical protein [Microbacterium sp. cf046]
MHIKLLGDLPVGSTRLSEARRAAGYLAKYVAKSFADSSVERDLALHRYDVAQGFQPARVRFSGASREEVLALASDALGEWPETVWSSRDAEDWQGPPVIWAQWGR